VSQRIDSWGGIRGRIHICNDIRERAYNTASAVAGQEFSMHTGALFHVLFYELLIII
jgi:hypothetical protein